MKKWIWWTIVGVCISFFSCLSPKNKLDSLFPSPGFEKGWKCDGKPKHYSPETLYQYIDGEADLYISYGFQELATLLYYWDSPEDTFVMADIYDMGTPLNAFGIYSNFRYPEYNFQNIGVEAFVSEYGLKFAKGQYFVDIKLGSFSKKCQRASLVIATEIVRRIKFSENLPRELELLPPDQQKPKTLRYVKKEMLNHGFLPGGVEARYLTSEGEAMGFVAIFDSLNQAVRGFDEFKTFYVLTTGNSLSTEGFPGEASFAVRTPYHGILIAFQYDRYIGGVKDVEKLEVGLPLLQAIFENLKRQEVPKTGK